MIQSYSSIEICARVEDDSCFRYIRNPLIELERLKLICIIRKEALHFITIDFHLTLLPAETSLKLQTEGGKGDWVFKFY